MKIPKILGVLVASLPLALSAADNTDKTVATFSGSGDKFNLGFSVRGAWELRWEVEGDQTFPSISQFNVRLHDAITGRYLGVVAQKTGSGSGVRHVYDGGRFHIHVLAKNVRWRIEIVDDAEPWESIPELEGADESYRMDVTVIQESEDQGEKNKEE